MGGALIAVAAHVVANAITIPITIVLFVTVISRNAEMLRLFQVTVNVGKVWGLRGLLRTRCPGRWPDGRVRRHADSPDIAGRPAAGVSDRIAQSERY